MIHEEARQKESKRLLVTWSSFYNYTALCSDKKNDHMHNFTIILFFKKTRSYKHILPNKSQTIAQKIDLIFAHLFYLAL